MPLPTTPLMPIPIASSSVSSRLMRQGSSQRDVSVLALGYVLPLGAQHRQRTAELGPGLLGQDHVVHVAQLGSLVRVGEGVAILLHQLLARAGALLQLAPEDDV